MFQFEACKMMRFTIMRFAIVAVCMSSVSSITQFIAALGSPSATSGNNAQMWGFWPVDPGPRGVRLKDFNEELADGVAPAGWHFNISDWYLEEYGRIMEKPNIPIQPGTYTVSVFQGGRSTTGKTALIIHPKNEDGVQLWELDGVQLLDVTHGPCRTGRYTPDGSGKTCSPANMPQDLFPVTPGGLMPTLEGCITQDYAVLFVSGFSTAIESQMPSPAPSSEAEMASSDGSASTNPAPSSVAEASSSDESDRGTSSSEAKAEANSSDELDRGASSSESRDMRQGHQLLAWLVAAALLRM